MAIEKVTMRVDYIGSAAEYAAITNKEVYHPGDSFYCWDTKTSYVFASGDWRVV